MSSVARHIPATIFTAPVGVAMAAVVFAATPMFQNQAQPVSGGRASN